MPSFCPKLESNIKVMHRRMAKNDQKFMKILFFPRVITKVGENKFSWVLDHFWPLYSASPKKYSKKYAKIAPSKKNPFLSKNEKWQFFLRRAINFPKMVKNSKFFCSITSYAPKNTEKIFMIIGAKFQKWNPDSWKKNVSV